MVNAKLNILLSAFIFLLSLATGRAQTNEPTETIARPQSVQCLFGSVEGHDVVKDSLPKELRQRQPIRVALRTNLLLPLLNFGAELPLGNRWSVGADWYYVWLFRSSSHKNCFQIDGLTLEGRYWLGSRHTNDPENKQYRLQGHSIGLFTMGGRYDIERNYVGHQGEYILGGVDYLYAKPIFKGKMHLELSFGVGYLYTRATRYEVYERGGKGFRDQNYRKNISYFGPLRASVALVVPLRWKAKTDDR